MPAWRQEPAIGDQQKIKEVEEGIREVDDAARDRMITRVVDRRLGRQESGRSDGTAHTSSSVSPDRERWST